MPRKRPVKRRPVTVEPQEIPALTPPIYLNDGDPNPDAIRFFRNQHDITQVMMAEFFNVDPKTIAYWERGITTPMQKNRDKVHQFCVATIRLIQRNNGIIPPHLRFRRLFDEGDSLTFRQLLELLTEGDIEGAKELVK